MRFPLRPPNDRLLERSRDRIAFFTRISSLSASLCWRSPGMEVSTRLETLEPRLSTLCHRVRFHRRPTSSWHNWRPMDGSVGKVSGYCLAGSPLAGNK